MICVASIVLFLVSLTPGSLQYTLKKCFKVILGGRINFLFMRRVIGTAQVGNAAFKIHLQAHKFVILSAELN